MAKSSKKRGYLSSSASPAKRGRPPKNDNSILMQRYPPIQTSCTGDCKSTEALNKELDNRGETRFYH